MNTNTAMATEQFVAMEVKTDAKLVRKILGSAADLVAAMNDPEHMVKRKKLSPEVRDSLDVLREECIKPAYSFPT